MFFDVLNKNKDSLPNYLDQNHIFKVSISKYIVELYEVANYVTLYLMTSYILHAFDSVWGT